MFDRFFPANALATQVGSSTTAFSGFVYDDVPFACTYDTNQVPLGARCTASDTDALWNVFSAFASFGHLMFRPVCLLIQVLFPFLDLSTSLASSLGNEHTGFFIADQFSSETTFSISVIFVFTFEGF